MPGGTAKFLSAKHFSNWGRIKHTMAELGPTRNVVLDCCVYGGSARRYVELLQLGLCVLVDHDGMA